MGRAARHGVIASLQGVAIPRDEIAASLKLLAMTT